MAHTDGPTYQPVVATLSLGSHTVLHLTPRPSSEASDGVTPTVGSVPATEIAIFLPARSLVVLSEGVYSDWMHRIEAVKLDTIDSLMSTINWDDYWATGGDVESSPLVVQPSQALGGPDGPSTQDSISKVTTRVDRDAFIAEVVARRRFAEQGKGWERSTRVSLTCRRVEKVRKAFRFG